MPSKPFDWNISTSLREGYKYLKGIVKSKPNLFAAEDANRSMEHIRAVTDQLHSVIGPIGKNVRVEFSQESISSLGSNIFNASVTATFSKITGGEAYISSSNARFPFGDDPLIATADNINFNALSSNVYCYLIAKRQVVSFEEDPELSGVETTEGDQIAGFETEVYTDVRVIFGTATTTFLTDDEEVICTLAEVFFDSANSPKFVSTFYSPDDIDVDFRVSSSGFGDINNRPTLHSLYDLIRRIPRVPKDYSTIVNVPSEFNPEDHSSRHLFGGSDALPAATTSQEGLMTPSQVTKLNGLDSAIVIQGNWNPATGVFPGGGSAQNGHTWISSGTGTVDGVEFTKNDRVVAIKDNASTSNYTNNWIIEDFSDSVSSVNGETGNVVLSVADISGALSTTTTFNGDVSGTYNNLQIKSSIIVGANLAYRTIYESRMADNSVSTRTVQNSAITNSKLGSSSVSTDKMQNDAATFTKIQNITGPTILGRSSTTSGSISTLTASTARGILGMEGYLAGTVEIGVRDMASEYWSGTTRLYTTKRQGAIGTVSILSYQDANKFSIRVFHSLGSTFIHPVVTMKAYVPSGQSNLNEMRSAIEDMCHVAVYNINSNYFDIAFREHFENDQSLTGALISLFRW